MGKAKRRKKLDPNYGKPTPSNDAIQLEGEILTEPDYQPLVDGYLKYGSSHLIAKIHEWMEGNDFPHIAYQNIDGKLVPNLDRLNKIAETVYVLASKQSKILASKGLKRGRFNLRVPSEVSDYGTEAPLRDHPELALEGMRLFNTGFFDEAITELINSDDVVSTLRKYVVLMYMGTNENHEIIDAACSLVRLKPFQVIKYVGEQRHSLDTRLENIFKPLASKIEDFRIFQKGADKYPCLTLLFVVENKTNQKFCEFTKHYTAQGGSQLIIPGFSSQKQGVYAGSPLNVLGNPINVPTIRGFQPSENNLSKLDSDIDSETEKKKIPLSIPSQESMKFKNQYINFPIFPEKAWELNRRLKVEGLGWFYKEFMTQKNMLESRCYSTEVILDIHPRIQPKKFNIREKEFSLPVVCFHHQSNIVKVLGIQEGEVVLVSRFQYFEQIQQKAPKPQFWGCVKLIQDIVPHYGYVGRSTWDSIDSSDDDENSLIVNLLRFSDDHTQGTVKTLIEREELGISVNRILIKVDISYLNESDGQEWQEVFVYLLDNTESYDKRIDDIIRKNLGDNWLSMSWDEP